MKILVVDDAPDVVEAVTISFNLQWRDTEVIGASDGAAALARLTEEHPDLVLLDIAMPGMDGFETLKRLRELSDVPVIMLTAKDSVLDKVKGLELGADDYVTKPFDHLELLARVRAVLRRLDMPQPASRAPSFQAGRLAVDFAGREVRVDGELVALTALEYKILYHLVRNAGRVLTHQTLLAKVWGREYTEEIDYLRVYMRRLRRKLEEDPDHPRYLLTERGIGYRFVAPPRAQERSVRPGRGQVNGLAQPSKEGQPKCYTGPKQAGAAQARSSMTTLQAQHRTSHVVLSECPAGGSKIVIPSAQRGVY
ncbi:MAG: response regulator transcription factor [Chloroflexota bacterium]